MANNTEFSKFIHCIKPLKEQNESIATFTRRVLEISTPYTEDYKTSQINRSDSTLKKYAYGSEEISKEFALDILKFYEEEDLKEFLDAADDSISQIILDNTNKTFNIPKLNLFNLSEKLSKLFTQIITIASTRDNKQSKVLLTSDNLNSHVLIEGNTLYIMGAKINLPKSEFTESISIEEIDLNYLKALIDAYGDAEGTIFDISDLSNLKNKYINNLRDQRINYFEADCLRRFTRDSIESSDDEFQNLLDDTYDGVIYTCNKSYSNGYERLLSVLEQATHISLNGSYLSQIPKLITNKRRYGFCHMLVNDNRIKWIEDNENE